MDDLKPKVVYEMFLAVNEDGTLRVLAKLQDRQRLIDVTEKLRDQFLSALTPKKS